MRVSAAIREAIDFEAFPGGPRLRCVTEPGDVTARGTVVLLPPFAEEMNKSRRMCARMARCWAEDGWRVVRLDLYGCGDSGGEFRDATWSRWVEDLQTEVRRSIGETPGPLWLWCVRGGALFVEPILEVAPAAHVLLWQPVLSGAVHLQQFMRLRMAAGLFGAGKASSADATPAQQFAAGRSAEIGGYEVSAALAYGLQSAGLRSGTGSRGRVVWLEVPSGEGASVSPATQRAVDAWRANGRDVCLELVPGAPFWQSTDIVENEGLLQRSRVLLADTMADATAAAAAPAEETVAISPADDVRESVLEIQCEGIALAGIVAEPADASAALDTGVVIVVGGPQYRVGSHRQFVQLARSLARDGLSVLRFDYRGMGDSDGTMRTFEEAGPDMQAAIDALLRSAVHIRRVVLWGLCDAASLILMHGASHSKVVGVALANPWVRNATTIAGVTLKHYYRGRLLQKELWRKMLRGGFDWRASIRSFGGTVAQALSARWHRHRPAAAPEFQTLMARGLAAFDGPVLLLLSGDDLTAREFAEYAATAPGWRGLLDADRVHRVDLPGVDHTFSRHDWQTQAEEYTRVWIRGMQGRP